MDQADLVAPEFKFPDEFFEFKKSTTDEFGILAIHDEILIMPSQDIESYLNLPISILYLTYNRPWIHYLIVAKKGTCNRLSRITKLGIQVVIVDLLSPDVTRA